MSLATFQSQFWHDLWGDHPVAPGLRVYRNTVLTACVDTLLSLYPAVHRLTGDAWMRAVALDFVRRHPPTDGTLQHYGERFADFIEAALPPNELAWLPDVARLERCWQDSHAAADAPVLDVATVAQLDEHRLTHATLQLHPTTRWQVSRQWPIFSLWQAARDAAADPNPPAWQGEGALLTRPGGAVQAIAINTAEAALLQACADGRPLGQAIEAMSAHPTDPGAALARLLNHGAFSALHVCTHTESTLQ